MAARLLDEEPELAYQHAHAAQRRAGRVGLVRESLGIAAYHLGHYEEALRELRTARRLTGSNDQLPVMADCERGLGRPERALDLAASDEARTLDRSGQLELLMVAAGARHDLGQHDAAVVMLQVPELQVPATAGSGPARAARARLMSAYSDALEASGRVDEARDWLQRAAAADVDGVTGAAERLGWDGLEPEEILDLLDDDDLEGVGNDEPATVPAAATAVEDVVAGGLPAAESDGAPVPSEEPDDDDHES